jgi:uncharacterized protein involved in exopolysaccharide biosynthesis
MDRYVGDGVRSELDLAAFVSLLWRYRRTVGITCGLGIVAGIAYLMVATSMYRGEAVIIAAPEDTMSSAAGASVGDKLGGLASLAGLNIGQESPDELRADAVLDSRELIEQFVLRNDLVGVLLKDYKRKTLWRAVNYFKNNLLKIKKDQMKGTTKVTVEWKDPTTAANWANGLVALANQMMRDRARADSSHNVEYITHQLADTNDVDLRRDLDDILESEMRTLMLANGRVEYAFQVVDPAVRPEVRSRPQLVLVLLIAIGLGLAVGSTIAFVRDRLAEQRREAAQSERLDWHGQTPTPAKQGVASVEYKR